MMRTGKRSIGAADDAILRAVHRYHFVTADHICRLLYSVTSLTYVRQRLVDLTKDGYLHRRFMPRIAPTGSTPAVYTLGPSGKTYLEAAGVAVGRLRHSDVDQAGFLHLRHALAVSDFLLSCELLANRWPDRFRLREMRHEQALRAAVNTLSNTQGMAIPDAWVDLRRRRADGAAVQSCLALELDRGTEDRQQWQQKVVGLAAFVAGAYQQLFDTTSLTLVVITTAGEDRVADLKRWTEAVLKQVDSAAFGHALRISTSAPAATAVEQFFLAPVWSVPFSEQQVALFERPTA